jgi:hypothetical protein
METGENVKKLQFLVPQELRKAVIKLAHSSPTGGHMGSQRTRDRVMQRFWWKGLKKDIINFCKRCKDCQLVVYKKPNEKVPMKKMPIFGKPFERISMDIVGPLPKYSAGNRFILVINDLATRYPEAIPIRTAKSPKIAEELAKYVSRHGIPKEILTDNEPILYRHTSENYTKFSVLNKY